MSYHIHDGDDDGDDDDDVCVPQTQTRILNTIKIRMQNKHDF